MSPGREDFQRGLDRMREDARNCGETSIVITSGDLHRRVGGYPGSDHRMPTCCDVMEKNMKGSDKVLPNALKRYGASFKVRYNI